MPECPQRNPTMAFSLSVPNLDTKSFIESLVGSRTGNRIGSRTRASGLTRRILIGLGLGGLAAAAYAAVRYYRSRTASRSRSNTAATPESGPYAPTSVPEQVSMDWILSGRGMDTLVPAAYSIPDREMEFVAPLTPDRIPQQPSAFASQPAGEPWTDTVRRAMEKKPLMFGYDKSAWTAPLLSQYLMETHGVAVPVPRLRNALRDMGYHWKHTHYVQARPGTGRHH